MSNILNNDSVRFKSVLSATKMLCQTFPDDLLLDYFFAAQGLRMGAENKTRDLENGDVSNEHVKKYLLASCNVTGLMLLMGVAADELKARGFDIEESQDDDQGNVGVDVYKNGQEYDYKPTFQD